MKKFYYLILFLFIGCADNQLISQLSSYYLPPPIDGESYKYNVALISDTQTDFNAESVFKKIVNLHIDKPLAVIHAGDINDKISSETMLDFDTYSKDIKGIPFYPVVGNHDISDRKLWKEKFIPNEKNYWYSKDIGTAHFIMIDTLNLNDEQLEWIKLDLSETDKILKFAVMHYPMYSSNTEHPFSEFKSLRDKLLPIFKEYKIAAVFNGHNHQYEHVIKDNIHFFTIGGANNKFATNNKNFPNNENAESINVINKIFFFALLSFTEKGSWNVEIINPSGISIANLMPKPKNEEINLLKNREKEIATPNKLFFDCNKNSICDVNKTTDIYKDTKGIFSWLADMDRDIDGALLDNEDDKYYQCHTSLHGFINGENKSKWNPLLLLDGPKSCKNRSNIVYVNSHSIRFYVVPGKFARENNIQLGDLGIIIDTKTNKATYAMYADAGPSKIIGEASTSAIASLGHNYSVDDDIIQYYSIPTVSKYGYPIPRSNNEMVYLIKKYFNEIEELKEENETLPYNPPPEITAVPPVIVPPEITAVPPVIVPPVIVPPVILKPVLQKKYAYVKIKDVPNNYLTVKSCASIDCDIVIKLPNKHKSLYIEKTRDNGREWCNITGYLNKVFYDGYSDCQYLEITN